MFIVKLSSRGRQSTCMLNILQCVVGFIWNPIAFSQETKSIFYYTPYKNYVSAGIINCYSEKRKGRLRDVPRP